MRIAPLSQPKATILGGLFSFHSFWDKGATLWPFDNTVTQKNEATERELSEEEVHSAHSCPSFWMWTSPIRSRRSKSWFSSSSNKFLLNKRLQKIWSPLISKYLFTYARRSIVQLKRFGNLTAKGVSPTHNPARTGCYFHGPLCKVVIIVLLLL